MSEDSSNNMTTEPINTVPPSMETAEILSYILGGEGTRNRDHRASPYNFISNTNASYIPMRRRRMIIPPNIETYLDISSNETTTNIINDMSDNNTFSSFNEEEDLYRRFLEDILQENSRYSL